MSHLILDVDPVYSTWQAFNQALLVDSPLLFYIDVRHANFLPPKLTVGEAQDLGPRYTCSDELAPIRDEWLNVYLYDAENRYTKGFNLRPPFSLRFL